MIVDFHTHVFPPGFRDRRGELAGRDTTFGDLFADPRARMATADELVSAMDEDGVDVSVVMGIGWTDPGVAREANDYIVDSVARHPGRLVGFAGVNPAWPDGGAEEAERCAAAGLRGVGELHPDTQGFDLGDPSTMAPLVEAARGRGLVLTTHSSEPVGHSYPGKGRTRPEALWRFIRAHPDVVCARRPMRAGAATGAAEERCPGLLPSCPRSLARRSETLYFDTAARRCLEQPLST